MPISGTKEVIPQIQDINQFFFKFLASNKAVLCAGGVEDHDDFVNLVKKALKNCQNTNENIEKNESLSRFVAKELKIECENDFNYATLSFEGLKITDSNFKILELINYIYKVISKRKQKPSFFLSTKFLNIGFEKAGLFGINVIVPASITTSIIDLIGKEIRDILNTNENDLVQAKKLYKLDFLETLDFSNLRIENTAKEYSLTKSLQPVSETLNGIDDISLSLLTETLKKIFQSPANFLYLGRNPNSIIGLEKIHNFIKEIK